MMRALRHEELLTLEDVMTAWMLAMFAIPLCMWFISMTAIYESSERHIEDSQNMEEVENSPAYSSGGLMVIDTSRVKDDLPDSRVDTRPLRAVYEPPGTHTGDNRTLEEAENFPDDSPGGLIVIDTSEVIHDFPDNHVNAPPKRTMVIDSSGSIEDDSLSHSDVGPLSWFILFLFGPTNVAIYSVLKPLRDRIQGGGLGQYQQLRVLKHLRSLTGVQALIGAAIAATLIQFDQGPAERFLLSTTVLWLGTALFYFCAHYYQTKMEQTN